MKKKPLKDFNGYLQDIFGRKVHKITIDADFGCPNRDDHGGCIYCNDRGSGTGLSRQGVSVEEQMRLGIAAVKRKYKNVNSFIAYIQSYTNTYAPPEVLKRTWEEVAKFPEVVGISVGTRPDCVNRENMDVLKGFSGKYKIFLELGLQSINEDTLRWIGRGHTVNDFIKAVELAKGYPFDIVAHVILGFPGQGRDEVIETARFLSRLNVHGVKLHLLYVTKGSRLEELHHNGAFSPVDMQSYITMACDFIEHLSPDIVIHRLTGDAHRGELIAPEWSKEKTKVINAIHEEFTQRDSFQGKQWKR